MKAHKKEGTSYSNKSTEPIKTSKQETKSNNGTSNAKNREKLNQETKTEIGTINTEKQKEKTTAETSTRSAKEQEKQKQETVTNDKEKRNQDTVTENHTNDAQQPQGSEVDTKLERSCSLEKRDEFAVGDFVLLSTDDIDLAMGEKAPTVTPYRLVGPFRINARISETSFKVAVPRSMGIDGIFESSKLVTFMKKERLANNAKERDSEKVIPSLEQQSVTETTTTTTTTGEQRPPMVLVDGQLEYEVEEVLDERIQHYEGGKRRLEYLVKWKGYSDAEATWEPRTNLKHVRKLLNEFLKKKQQ